MKDNRTKCVLCGGNDFKRIFYSGDIRFGLSNKKFKVARCKNCHLTFTLGYGKKNFYPQYYEGISFGDDNLKIKIDKFSIVSKYFKEPGRILDVGSGYGGFLQYANKNGWQGLGVENSGRAALKSRKRKIKIIRGNFNKVGLSGNFDLITFWHSLEHMPDPLVALKKARTLIGKKGKIIIDLPNIASFSAKLFNNNFAGLDIPRHLFHFTPETLGKVLWRAGLKIEDISYWSREHSAANFFYSLVNFIFGQKTFTALVIKKKNDRLGKGGKIYFKIMRFISRLAITFFYPIALLESRLGVGSNMTIIASPRNELKTAEVSIGIPAYNEEKDIVKTLKAIIRQKLRDGIRISEIIAVDDSSQDKTKQKILQLMKKYKFIKLHSQPQRMGKSAAINYILKNAQGDLVVVANADNIPDKSCLQNLLDEMVGKKVALVGPRIVCINSDGKLVGFMNRLIWRLHHKIALKNPKTGGFVLINKKIINSLPKESPVDESTLEAIAQRNGYKVAYANQAILYLKGPNKFKDYFLQRRRIHAGYLWLKKTYPSYHPSTFKSYALFLAFFGELSFDMVDNFYLFVTAVVEISAKIFGIYDFYCKRQSYQTWRMATSSKNIEINE